MADEIFIDSFTDFGFKKLFGEEASKDLLKDFLNQFLPKKHQVGTFVFANPEVQPELKYERISIFDIHCKSKTGKSFIVEMQNARLDYFRDRALYYAAAPIRSQAPKGKWDYNLQPVYFIAILNFQFIESSKKKNFKVSVMLKDQDGDVFYDKLHFYFLQMPLFEKKETELETHFDKWLFFLKNLVTFESIPKILNEPVFEKGFEIARLANLNQTELEKYRQSQKQYKDMMGIIETAKKEARKQGRKEGKSEGILQGKKEGILQGKKEVARLLLNMGETVEKVMELTNLTKEQVSELSEDN